MNFMDTVRAPIEKTSDPLTGNRLSQRVASIDWMRGLVMVLMIVVHASMAFDAHHLDHDSAMYADAGTMALPAAKFLPLDDAPLCAYVCLPYGNGVGRICDSRKYSRI